LILKAAESLSEEYLDDMTGLFMTYSSMLVESVLCTREYRDQLSWEQWDYFLGTYFHKLTLAVSTDLQTTSVAVYRLSLCPFVALREKKMDFVKNLGSYFQNEIQDSPSSAYLFAALNHVLQESAFDQREEFEELAQLLHRPLMRVWDCRTTQLKVELVTFTLLQHEILFEGTDGQLERIRNLHDVIVAELDKRQPHVKARIQQKSLSFSRPISPPSLALLNFPFLLFFFM